MDLKYKLDYHYKAFDITRISPDPLQFLHFYSDEKDIEVMGFIAAVFAYGNVQQIINTLNRFLGISGGRPYKFITSFSSHKDDKILHDLYHRFYTYKDIINLFLVMEKVYEEYGSLKKVFLKYYSDKDENIKNALSGFSHHFIEEIKIVTGFSRISPGAKFMFPLPELGSACKRKNLFLRWMVRKDELDFGLWHEIPRNKLVIPVDTHVARICRQIKLTSLKNVSWKMAEEITENLKKYDPDDPVKYDFAICHIGMRKMVF
jgi:uncharacterized protein (TIGR02757 family)